jgi:SNF2 family DNA or RNA helicase
MLERERQGEGGILADEMGLGKTIQMAGLIKSKMCEHTLLITPVAVIQQWKSILLKSKVNVFIPDSSNYTWKSETKTLPLAANVYIIGYESALRKTSLVKTFKVGKPWDRLIYDEAHRLGSGNTSTDLCKLIHAEHTWLLTGTPIVNTIKNLTTLLEITGADTKHSTDLNTLAPVLKSCIMSRSMDDLRSTIEGAPPKPEFVTVRVPFSTEEEKDFYLGMTGIIRRRWKALDADGGGGAVERFKLFMRLRQLSLHPQIYISARKQALKNLYTRPDWEGSSTKFDTLRNIICDSPTQHKWIVFCHFHMEMDMLQTMFKAESCVEMVQQYHGGLTSEAKQDVIERTHIPLTQGKQDILLVQLQSGGTGLNLQHFDKIIMTGPWWTKALMEQAVGRAVRIGQKKVVTVYNIILEEEEALNIDRFMTEKSNEKGELCRTALSYAERSQNVKDLQLPDNLSDVSGPPCADLRSSL